MTSYTARAERDGDWWAIDVPEVDGVFTQARRLDQIEAMARDVIALMLDVDPASFDLKLDVTFPPAWAEVAAQVVGLRKASADADRELGLALRRAARDLKSAGLPVRDVGQVLGVSAQRVSQLANS